MEHPAWSPLDDTLFIRTTDSSEYLNWTPTPESVRHTVLGGQICGTFPFANTMTMPEELTAMLPTIYEIMDITEGCAAAINAGQLIDFGFWSNAAIKNAGRRGGELYAQGLLRHPFTDPWMFMHSWDPRVPMQVYSVYFVNPLEPGTPNGDYECVELCPMRLGRETVLTINDRVSYERARQPLTSTEQFQAIVRPSAIRFLPRAGELINGHRSAASAAASNVLDPLMCALLMLATPGVVRRRIDVSEKLQRARLRSHKPPIPPYERVDSQAFVAAMAI